MSEQPDSSTGAVTSLEDPPAFVPSGVRFRDRRDAGRRLAELLEPYRAQRPVVVGIPRGGIPVAAEVARALDAPLDVTIVRKIGAPQNPEFAIGALAEGGVHVLDERVVRTLGISGAGLRALTQEIEGELVNRVLCYRGARGPLELQGRTVILVDDGLATGNSARAAVRSLRGRGAERVILAVPVAAPESADALRGDADEVVCVEEPVDLWAVGLWYEDFRPTTDEEVVALLADRHEETETDRLQADRVQADSPITQTERPIAQADPPITQTERPIVQADDPIAPIERPVTQTDHPITQTERPVTQADPPIAPTERPITQTDPVPREVAIPLTAHITLSGELMIPPRALGVVAFAHGSGSSRMSPRNRAVARALNEASLATLLFDLLTPDEEVDRSNVFDIGLLAERLIAASAWLAEREDVDLPLGYFGASTGAAAALSAAAKLGERVRAVVSRGGRPDLAENLEEVRAPTLLIVGGADHQVLELNREAQMQLRCPSELAIVPGATHLFEEPGALEHVSRLASDWFVRHLTPAPPADPEHRSFVG